MDDCVEPAGIFAAYADCAAALDAWHAGGSRARARPAASAGSRRPTSGR